MQAEALLHSCRCCLEGLAAAPPSELVGTSRKLGRQVAAAQNRLLQQLEALRADAIEQAPAERATQLRQLLPAPEQVAAAFDAYCRRSSQQAAARLEVVQVRRAATCAALMCRRRAARWCAREMLDCAAGEQRWVCGWVDLCWLWAAP